MNVICFVHVDQERYDCFSPAEKQALDRENTDYFNWLVANGHNVLSSSLHEPETATVIRSKGGKVSMMDGPYVETKEHVGGVMIIRVRDRKEALEVAARSPVVRYGAIEVRETHYQEP